MTTLPGRTVHNVYGGVDRQFTCSKCPETKSAVSYAQLQAQHGWTVLNDQLLCNKCVQRHRMRGGLWQADTAASCAGEFAQADTGSEKRALGL